MIEDETMSYDKPPGFPKWLRSTVQSLMIFTSASLLALVLWLTSTSKLQWHLPNIDDELADTTKMEINASSQILVALVKQPLAPLPPRNTMKTASIDGKNAAPMPPKDAGDADKQLLLEKLNALKEEKVVAAKETASPIEKMAALAEEKTAPAKHIAILPRPKPVKAIKAVVKKTTTAPEEMTAELATQASQSKELSLTPQQRQSKKKKALAELLKLHSQLAKVMAKHKLAAEQTAASRPKIETPVLTKQTKAPVLPKTLPTPLLSVEHKKLTAPIITAALPQTKRRPLVDIEHAVKGVVIRELEGNADILVSSNGLPMFYETILGSEVRKTENGLVQRKVRKNFGYDQQDIFTGEHSREAYVLHCQKSGQKFIRAMCWRELQASGEHRIQYRFPRSSLKDWKKIETQVLEAIG